jgi:hypothetical protein
MAMIPLKDMIFVFGSNIEGRHGSGAARYAAMRRKAKWGVGEGLTGECYALPTVKKIGAIPMTLAEINVSVAKFIGFAETRPDLTFQVTRIGCGLAGRRDEDIAPMFSKAPENCLFDLEWRQFLNFELEDIRFWGTF